MNKARVTFHFNPPISIEGSWMIGLTDLHVYNSILNITEENNKFELYKFPDENAGGISYEKVRDDIEKDLDISDITVVDLQDDIKAPNIIEEYSEKVTKTMEDDKYMPILAMYFDSIFQDFESSLRTETDVVKDNIRLVFDEYVSSFDTYEIEPGFKIFKGISEAFLQILQPEYDGYHNASDIGYDDITMKTKLVVRPVIIAKKFDDK